MSYRETRRMVREIMAMSDEDVLALIEGEEEKEQGKRIEYPNEDTEWEREKEKAIEDQSWPGMRTE